MKKDATELVAWQCKDAEKVTKPYRIGLDWVFPNKRADPDNRIFAKKFLLDGLQEAGVIPNDSYKWFRGILFENWEVGKPSVTITIEHE